MLGGTMSKIKIPLLIFLLISANAALPQAEDITKQFNDAYRAFQSLNQEGKPEESLEFAKKALDLENDNPNLHAIIQEAQMPYLRYKLRRLRLKLNKKII